MVRVPRTHRDRTAREINFWDWCPGTFATAECRVAKSVAIASRPWNDHLVDHVVIGSHEAKFELLCVDRLPTGSAELLRARVRAPGLDCERDAYEYGGYQALAAFFDDMAGSWRGWPGERVFASLEGDLEVVAVHDGRHVELVIRLRQFGSGDWTASATVIVDPGEDLAASARSVRDLVGAGRSSRSPDD